MRDPNRIRPMLALLAKYWERYPDLRLGQMVVSLASRHTTKDAFYIEDADLEEVIREELRKLR